MEFPHVDERTEERFARLWPLHSDNIKVKEAAKEDPSMIAGSREGGNFHFKLYESRIPVGFDADRAFGAWATDEAKAASLQESASHRASVGVGERRQRETVNERYPENIRYYPAVEAPEGKDRAAFNEVADRIAKERNVTRKDIVAYAWASDVKAYVSKIGPIAELAYFQTPEARAAWDKEGEKLKLAHEKNTSRASDVVDRAALQAEGKDFLAKYGKGLPMPSKQHEAERTAIQAEIRSASFDELKAVQAACEREFKPLEKKLYAMQIKGAQQRDPGLTVEAFNALKPDDRRKASGYADLAEDEFRKMVRMKSGFRVISAELNERGEHLTVDQARNLKGQSEAKEQAKPVDEKGQAMKSETETKAPDQAEKPRQQGRQSSSRAAAAQLASNLGRR